MSTASDATSCSRPSSSRATNAAVGKIAIKRICLTCQHWDESSTGTCLIDSRRPIKNEKDTCEKWRKAKEL